MLLDKGVMGVFETPLNVEQFTLRVKMVLRLAELHQKLQLVDHKHERNVGNTNYFCLHQPLPDKKLFPAFDYTLVQSAI